ncbi:MAG: peptidylprolyl isomerase [Candidatus Marinimicrobia bacterium]|nr:peptidylprolyl isomerase [Candidatus Neomarinimicrobiota bacterium]
MKFKFILTFSLFIFILPSCDKSIAPEILATVGSREVTSYDFSESYSKRLVNSQLKDSEIEREKHLQFLIRNKLFSEAALRDKLELDSIAHRYIQLDSIKYIRDELYYEMILNHEIDMNDEIMRKHYLWANRECHFKHLFYNNKERADSVFLLLAADSSLFDSIAFQTFSDERLKKSGGDLGWIRYNDLDPNLELKGFDLDLDLISAPIRSSFGWHILKKIDERNQMITDESEFQTIKNGIKKTIIRKMNQIQSDQFVNDLMLSKNILLDDSLIQDVTSALFQLALLHGENPPITGEQKGEVIFNLFSNLRDVAELQLAQYDDGEFIVQDYMDGIQSLPTVQTNYSPKTTFYHALRNKILSEEGGKNDLGNHPNVQLKLQDSKDRFLTRAYLSTFFDGKTQGAFSKEKLDSISNSLRENIPVTLYPEHLERLFVEN